MAELKQENKELKTEVKSMKRLITELHSVKHEVINYTNKSGP